MNQERMYLDALLAGQPQGRLSPEQRRAFLSLTPLGRSTLRDQDEAYVARGETPPGRQQRSSSSRELLELTPLGQAVLRAEQAGK